MKSVASLLVGIILMASTAFAANGNLTVDGVIHSNGNHFNVLSYSLLGTPTYGLKINTNIPYADQNGMETVILEGYSFDPAALGPVNLTICWYIHSGSFTHHTASTSSRYEPVIKLAKETRNGSDYVVIFIDDRRYCPRFSVRAYGKGLAEQDSWFEGWTVSDSNLDAATNIVTVPYNNIADLHTLANGNVGIGTATPAYKLQVMGSVASNSTVLTSDASFKKNLQPITSPLEKLLNLTGLSYEWKTADYKERNFPAGRHYGVIAQEVEKVLPEVVSTAPDGSKAVAYTELIPVLIEAIKAQQTEIEKLKKMLGNFN